MFEENISQTETDSDVQGDTLDLSRPKEVKVFFIFRAVELIVRFVLSLRRIF